MADKLTDEEIMSLREAFAVFDRDGTGMISTKKLNAVMKTLGQNPTESEVQDIINEVDADGHGTLEFSAFVTIMSRKMKEIEREGDIRDAFRVFDMDKRGYISPTEFRLVMTNLQEKCSEKDVDEMLSVVDKNGDGRIEYKEFKAMMAQQK